MEFFCNSLPDTNDNNAKKITIDTMNLIDEDLKKLSVRLKNTNKPIFIELIGTPKSGKTTLKTALEKCLSNSGIDVITRRETAEYNPVEKNSEYYNMWMILELLKNISEDLSKKSGQVIIYDRGILDRIPWMNFDVKMGKMNNQDVHKLIELYYSNPLKKYKPIAQVFETSPQLSVQRKGKPGYFVNETTIGLYNSILREHMSEIINNSSSTGYIFTDKYQGNIKEFLVSNTQSIISGINKELDSREQFMTID